LHTLAGGSALSLTFLGRKSGRSYTVPLGYVQDGQTLVCFTDGEWSAWWKNLRGGVPVTARLNAFLRRFPATANRYGVGLDSAGLPEARDVDAAVRRGKAVMILMRLGPE
jgi:hypothetical protein